MGRGEVCGVGEALGAGWAGKGCTIHGRRRGFWRIGEGDVAHTEDCKRWNIAASWTATLFFLFSVVQIPKTRSRITNPV